MITPRFCFYAAPLPLRLPKFWLSPFASFHGFRRQAMPPAAPMRRFSLPRRDAPADYFGCHYFRFRRSRRRHAIFSVFHDAAITPLADR